MTDEQAARAAEQRVLEVLDRLGVAHEIVRIDPAYAATADFCREYGYTMEQSINCIVVTGKAEPPLYAACMVQATRRLDVNGTIKRRFGVRKASFAPADVAVELTGMLPDGVTPLGLPDGLPVWIDAPVMEQDRIIVGGGSRALKILMPAEGLLRLPARRPSKDCPGPSDFPPEGCGLAACACRCSARARRARVAQVHNYTVVAEAGHISEPFPDGCGLAA